MARRLVQKGRRPQRPRSQAAPRSAAPLPWTGRRVAPEASGPPAAGGPGTLRPPLAPFPVPRRPQAGFRGQRPALPTCHRLRDTGLRVRPQHWPREGAHMLWESSQWSSRPGGRRFACRHPQPGASVTSCQSPAPPCDSRLRVPGGVPPRWPRVTGAPVTLNSQRWSRIAMMPLHRTESSSTRSLWLLSLPELGVLGAQKCKPFSRVRDWEALGLRGPGTRLLSPAGVLGPAPCREVCSLQRGPSRGHHRGVRRM